MVSSVIDPNSCNGEAALGRASASLADGEAIGRAMGLCNDKECERELSRLLPPRAVSDLMWIRRSECLTQRLTPRLRTNYTIDRLLCRLGRILLRI